MEDEEEEERRRETATVMSRIKSRGQSFAASLKQGWQYTKAFFMAQMKKLKARNERDASEADLQATKMQVEAADEAEERKKQQQLVTY